MNNEENKAYSHSLTLSSNIKTRFYARVFILCENIFI